MTAVLPAQDRPAWSGPDRNWQLARLAVQSWYEPLSGLRVWGRDRVPATGACVLAINHIGVLDPIQIGMASPRTVDYMAKRELFDVPGLRHVIAAFGAFSVRRGSSDRDAIRLARDRLRAERCLGIFVEGTRQPTQAIGTVKPGAAMLALAEDVPVVAVCLQVHRRGGPGVHASVRLRGSPRVAFGAPLDLSGHGRNARGYRAAAAEIEAELRNLRSFIAAAERVGSPVAAVPPAARPDPSAEVPDGRP